MSLDLACMYPPMTQAMNRTVKVMKMVHLTMIPVCRNQHPTPHSMRNTFGRRLTSLYHHGIVCPSDTNSQFTSSLFSSSAWRRSSVHFAKAAMVFVCVGERLLSSREAKMAGVNSSKEGAHWPSKVYLGHGAQQGESQTKKKQKLQRVSCRGMKQPEFNSAEMKY